MRTALQRIAAGALAYIVSYVLIGLVTIPRLNQYLRPNREGVVTVLEVYHSAGSPLWQAIGWFTLNANGVPINIYTGSGNAIPTVNFVSDGSLWFGVIPGWFGLVPMVACFLVGVVVAATSRPPSPFPLSVGAYMVPGYLVALLASTVVFAGGVGPVNASVKLIDTYPADRWLLPTLLTPLLFGSLGAFLGQSPFLKSNVENMVSKLSLR